MSNDLTLRKLSNTNFSELYSKLLTDKYMDKQNIMKLYELAILFINCKDNDIRNLGYRIIVLLSNKLDYYRPLYDIAINLGLYPIAFFIQRKNHDQYSLYSEIDNIMMSHFKSSENKIFTEEQLGLKEYYRNNIMDNIAVIAPTSYGKSDLIINTIKDMDKTKNLVVIVPSKALLNQTRQRILKAKPDWLKKIIVYPEMYTGEDNGIVAVLTQERLLRLLKIAPNLKFDIAIVDEAHNILMDDDRIMLLSSCLIVLEKRNSETIFKFLTPFIKNRKNLELKHTKYKLSGYEITERLKTEKYYIYENNELCIYDQYVNEFYPIKQYAKDNVKQFIKDTSLNKNIIYLNKPKDIEHFALEFSKTLNDIDDNQIISACKYLKEYMDDSYSLVQCLRKGVIYHHGSIPENIREYIEQLYIDNNRVKYVITSSTLLEGVNIPGSNIYILDNEKGRGNLSVSDFKNLVGRICRFGDIFSGEEASLHKLEPNIFIINTKYCRKGCNLKTFLQNTVRETKEIKDNTKNVLLKNVIDFNDKQLGEEEFIENYEDGTIKDKNIFKAKTKIGALCYTNNIFEINIKEKEQLMQNSVDNMIKTNKHISTNDDLLKYIVEIFINNITPKDGNRNLMRLQHKEACNFYNMFLEWRIKNATYKQMIFSFVRYWEQKLNRKEYLIYVGSKWGEITREGHRKLWVNLTDKSKAQLINLAIVRIKEEQDFVEYSLMKFVEILNDLNLIEEIYYNKLKYCTNNKELICLLKNGITLYLGKILIEKYREYIDIDIKNNILVINECIINKMIEDQCNEVLVLEVKQFCA